MRQFCLFVLYFAFASVQLAAQTVADFEEFNLPPNTFLNNAGPAGAFSSGPLVLPNNYNPQWMSWDGWAISNRRDTLTQGFLNESSAIAGGGALGSAIYAVSYVFNSTILRLAPHVAGSIVQGMYITNNAYAYYSMKNGDAFAKKFGGITGNDPDFFLLTIKKYLGGQLSADSVNFYLADYRFTNNALDYIIKDWTYVDLSSLGPADSLQFTLSSSDVGAFGMNTPAYFCMDHVVVQPVSASRDSYKELITFRLFPNPATDYIVLSSDYFSQYTLQIAIYDLKGKLWLTSNQPYIDISMLPSGMYVAHCRQANSYAVLKFVVR